MHHLVAQMDQSAAVVASHAALAAITGMSPSTIKRAINDLKAGNWIEVVQLGGKAALSPSSSIATWVGPPAETSST